MYRINIDSYIKNIVNYNKDGEQSYYNNFVGGEKIKNINQKFTRLIIPLIFVSVFFVALSAVNAADINITSSDNLGGTVQNASNGDTINLDVGTYSNNVTNIVIDKNLTLKGNGSSNNVIIDAQQLGRVFNVTSGNTLTLINLTLTNGFMAANGGTIFNSGTVTMTNCTFTNNLVNGSNVGGAIYNDGNVNIFTSEFRNNTANNGGAIYNNGTLQINSSNFTANNSPFGGAIYTTMTAIINNSNFNNNTGSQGGAIRNSGTPANLTITNSNFTNNNAVTINVEGFGGAIYNMNGNVNISNSIFNHNGAELEGGAIFDNAILSGTMNINNSTFINNTATDFGGAIMPSESINMNINNSKFINNTARQGGAIFNSFGINTTVSNSSFINNTANAGGAIYNPDESSMNVYSSNFTNNSVNLTGGAIRNNGDMIIDMSNFSNNAAANGAAIYTGTVSNLNLTSSNLTNNAGGAVININGIATSITGSNIFNNTQGIIIGSNAVNTTLNYNRIFNNTNTTGFDLVNNAVNTVADLNWWGDNTPLVSGITLGNYFIMNVTNATPLISNGSVSFNYTFKLNTNDTFDASLLPFFVTNVFTNVTSGAIDTFDARFDRIVNSTLNVKNQTVEYTFITDNEVQTLNVFFNPKIKTIIEVNNVEGKDGETVTLVARLTDENGTPLAGKELTFHVAGQTFTAITDSNGIATVQYTINKDDFTDGTISFTVTFEEDETYLASNATGIITLIEEPNPPTPTPTPNITNETTNVSAATAANAVAMKKTGMPIIAILIVLLSSLGLIYRKK